MASERLSIGNNQHLPFAKRSSLAKLDKMAKPARNIFPHEQLPKRTLHLSGKNPQQL